MTIYLQSRNYIQHVHFENQCVQSQTTEIDFKVHSGKISKKIGGYLKAFKQSNKNGFLITFKFIHIIKKSFR